MFLWYHYSPNNCCLIVVLQSSGRNVLQYGCTKKFRLISNPLKHFGDCLQGKNPVSSDHQLPGMYL